MRIEMLKKLRSLQHGFTLIEVLMVLAITGIIAPVIVLSISQLFSVNASSISRMSAIKQMESIIDSIRPDIQMGQQIVTSDPNDPNVFLAIYWTDWDNNQNNIKYSWNPITHELKRTPAKSALNAIAKNIASKPVVSKMANNNWSITLVATVEDYKSSTESRTFEVNPRSGR
jgi:prepilin-type N-terminal cleavage/methylation domain-containing protein